MARWAEVWSFALDSEPSVRTSSDRTTSPLLLVISSFSVNRSAMASEYASMADCGGWPASPLRRPARLPILAITVAALAWVFAGNGLPICAARACTRAASAFVAACARCSCANSDEAVWFRLGAPLGQPVGVMAQSAAVRSRSFSIACASAVTSSPRTASCVVCAYPVATPAAAATRRPPKTTPMTTAIMMTAMSRRDTGQLLSESAGSFGTPALKPCGGTAALPAGSSPAGTSGLFIALPTLVDSFFEMRE